MGFLSVNIFNRRKLMVDSSAEYIMRCVSELERAGIPHELHTKRIRNQVPQMMRNGNMLDYGISQQTMNPVDNLYTYTLWVPRRHFEKAKRAVHI